MQEIVFRSYEKHRSVGAEDLVVDTAEPSDEPGIRLAAGEGGIAEDALSGGVDQAISAVVDAALVRIDRYPRDTMLKGADLRPWAGDDNFPRMIDVSPCLLAEFDAVVYGGKATAEVFHPVEFFRWDGDFALGVDKATTFVATVSCQTLGERLEIASALGQGDCAGSANDPFPIAVDIAFVLLSRDPRQTVGKPRNPVCDFEVRECVGAIGTHVKVVFPYPVSHRDQRKRIRLGDGWQRRWVIAEVGESFPIDSFLLRGRSRRCVIRFLRGGSRFRPRLHPCLVVFAEVFERYRGLLSVQEDHSYGVAIELVKVSLDGASVLVGPCARFRLNHCRNHYKKRDKPNRSEEAGLG